MTNKSLKSFGNPFFTDAIFETRIRERPSIWQAVLEDEGCFFSGLVFPYSGSKCTLYYDTIPRNIRVTREQGAMFCRYWQFEPFFHFEFFIASWLKIGVIFWIEKDSLPWKDSYSWIVSSDVMAVISSVSFSEWIEIASSDFWCSRLTGLLLPPLLSESPFSVLFCRKLTKGWNLKQKSKVYLEPLRGGARERWCRLRPWE